ncbi:class I SAM-dependent methyltransferase [Streptomyces sp. SCA3-4]|uniref:class I SAM-dependent methyltransferase n=1 Tax=Streptomyces sichuanensis TaxID=2871810 RepID=UPI001CE338D6|nr:class I SAM-dependent methyltransferase [Streptomyces sichuanensis]MCA6091410.1 class I SAM-dependent methyltransferase [Streptomyces sichuanensis]
MDPSDHRAQALSFGVAAAAYQRGRPPYPAEAIDWMVPATTRRVLDLGAGTGKLTRQLHERGLETIAVEPDGQMRAELTRRLPDVLALPGSAEAVPLPDGSVNTVVAAQVWHWVDTERALPEIARTLTPHGTLSVVWNTPDEREDWVSGLDRILHPRGTPRTSSAGVGIDAIQPPFAPPQYRTVEWRHCLTRAELLDLVTSGSSVIALPPADRTALLSEVRAFCDTHPALAGTDRITMPYVTHCYRTHLR